MQTYELDIELVQPTIPPLEFPVCCSNLCGRIPPRTGQNIWWERLLKDKIRQHWLRFDFQNWRDEDNGAEEKEPFEEVTMSNYSFIPCFMIFFNPTLNVEEHFNSLKCDLI